MSLLGGTWAINANGHEGELNLAPPDAQGNLTGTVYGQEIFGFWDANTQKATFMRLLNPADPATFQVFTGYLFQNTYSSPSDITYTLAGHFEAFQQGGGAASRSVFGWFAQLELNL